MAKSEEEWQELRRVSEALFTATGRQRSVETLAGRLATAAPGSPQENTLQRAIARTLRTETRASRAEEAVRNLPGAEFMSPAQLRAAVGAGGVVRRPGETRARRTRAARRGLVGAERSRENRRLSEIRETMRSRF